MAGVTAVGLTGRFALITRRRFLPRATQGLFERGILSVSVAKKTHATVFQDHGRAVDNPYGNRMNERDANGLRAVHGC